MTRIRKLIDPLLLACQSILVFLAFYTLSPRYQVVPHRDSGIFLYIGSELLRGKVLYLQTWDNKQPLLYWLNAAGLWLGGGSPWGVWALELAFYLIGLILLYLLLRKMLAPLTSFCITAASFLTLYQIMSGNFSEEYALFLQMALLAVLFFIYLPNRRRFFQATGCVGDGAAHRPGLLHQTNLCGCCFRDRRFHPVFGLARKKPPHPDAPALVRAGLFAAQPRRLSLFYFAWGIE